MKPVVKSSKATKDAAKVVVNAERAFLKAVKAYEKQKARDIRWHGIKPEAIVDVVMMPQVNVDSVTRMRVAIVDGDYAYCNLIGSKADLMTTQVLEKTDWCARVRNIIKVHKEKS
jgi:hypothetical protein